MNRLLYSLHKWISAAAFLQLTIWTITGLLFATIPQKSIQSTPVDNAHHAVVTTAPSVTIARALDVGGPVAGEVERVELRALPAGAFYVVKGDKGTARVDAQTGALAPVPQAEAEATARRDQPNSPAIRQTTYVTESPHIEYRDCPLPAWRVELADASGTVIYVDASTGDVSARRNDRWRQYDFLWSLHVMDYKGRDNFNHPLIVVAASLAVATALSGIILLCVRATRFVQRKWRARRSGGGRPAVRASDGAGEASA